MHPAAEHLFELETGGFADGLDGLAAFADDDALLALALDEDRLIDPDRAVLLLFPGFGDHGRGIGQLVVQAQIELLARDLGREQARGNVGGLVRRIEPRTFGNVSDAIRHQIVDAIALQRGDHEHAIEDARRVQRLDERQQGIALQRIDLVEHENGAAPGALQTFDDAIGVLAGQSATVGRKLFGIDRKQHDIGIGSAAPCGLDHRAVEPAPRREDAGRVDEDELRVSAHRDAAHRHARGLHLLRDDGDLLADGGVDERGLAGIRGAQDGNEAASRVGAAAHAFQTPSRWSMRVAASCSASRLVSPSPRCGSWPGMRTSIEKLGAWSGPLRSVTT